MKPMEAGLTLAYAYDDGVILGPEDLTFDLDAYRTEVASAARNALGLSVEAGYIMAENAPLMIAKAFRNALALSLEAEIPTAENVDKLLARAHRDMQAVSQRLAAVNQDAAPSEGATAV
jgi:large subunit ribosomal protein L10